MGRTAENIGSASRTAVPVGQTFQPEPWRFQAIRYRFVIA